MESIQTDVLVIGAGVVGLAIAEQLSRKRNVVLAEAYPQFGRETSSRNSEVIHSGIYYPPSSKKTEWCLKGRELLYAFCAKYQVPHAAVGKFVIATDFGESAYLEKLSAHCQAMGVPHERWTQVQVDSVEPLIAAKEAVFLPRTGIVDSHQYMAKLEQLFEANGGLLAYRHRVSAITKGFGGWQARVMSPEGELEIQAPLVVNVAGLGAAELSNQTLATDRFQHKFCRGRYFTLSPRYQNKFRRLIYPVPPKDGLGIHVTVDLAGYARLGPDVEWCEELRYENTSRLYDCDWDRLRPPFAAAVRRYCPSIKDEDLSPALIGIRPKLFINGAAHPDFLVENHGGFIHCLGIESPGLTSSLAIAAEVETLA